MDGRKTTSMLLYEIKRIDEIIDKLKTEDIDYVLWECYTKRDSLIDELKKRLESNNLYDLCFIMMIICITLLMFT